MWLRYAAWGQPLTSKKPCFKKGFEAVGPGAFRAFYRRYLRHHRQDRFEFEGYSRTRARLEFVLQQIKIQIQEAPEPWQKFIQFVTFGASIKVLGWYVESDFFRPSQVYCVLGFLCKALAGFNSIGSKGRHWTNEFLGALGWFLILFSALNYKLNDLFPGARTKAGLEMILGIGLWWALNRAKKFGEPIQMRAMRRAFSFALGYWLYAFFKMV